MGKFNGLDDGYIKERNRFYKEGIHDDKKFTDWMGIDKEELKC